MMTFKFHLFQDKNQCLSVAENLPEIDKLKNIPQRKSIIDAIYNIK